MGLSLFTLFYHFISTELKFSSMIRDWCWELVRKDLVNHERRNPGMITNPFRSFSHLRSRLEKEVLPTLCSLSPPPEPTRPADAPIGISRSTRAVRQRAERTSHLQLDGRRMLVVQELYDEELGWYSKELEQQELEVCEGLIALEEEEV